jgi:hypothetical protein
MRKFQLLAVAAVASALTALAAVAGLAEAQAQVAPANTSPPTISGTARDGDTLVVDEGSWSGTDPMTFTFQWQSCDLNGLGCVDIGGATGWTYDVRTADVGHRLRVRVTATNATGSSSANSQATAVATPPEGATQLSNGRFSIPASSVRLPHRLVVSGVEFSPTVLRSRAQFTGRFRVTDTRGYFVRDAVVLLTGVPLGWIAAQPEIRTNAEGLATMQVQPTTRLRLVRGGSMVMFVRARKDGDNILAGVSSRRLVRVRTARPSF